MNKVLFNVLYFLCNLLIVLCIYRWIETGRLPYNDAASRLPADMQFCSRDTQMFAGGVRQFSFFPYKFSFSYAIFLLPTQFFFILYNLLFSHAIFLFAHFPLPNCACVYSCTIDGRTYFIKGYLHIVYHLLAFWLKLRVGRGGECWVLGSGRRIRTKVIHPLPDQKLHLQKNEIQFNDFGTVTCNIC